MSEPYMNTIKVASSIGKKGDAQPLNRVMVDSIGLEKQSALGVLQQSYISASSQKITFSRTRTSDAEVARYNPDVRYEMESARQVKRSEGLPRGY